VPWVTFHATKVMRRDAEVTPEKIPVRKGRNSLPRRVGSSRGRPIGEGAYKSRGKDGDGSRAGGGEKDSRKWKECNWALRVGSRRTRGMHYESGTHNRTGSDGRVGKTFKKK